MEQVHGVDVSWMTHGSAKDKASRNPAARRQSNPPAPSRETPRSPPPPPTTTTNGTATKTQSNGGDNNNGAASKPIPTPRPPVKRSDSNEHVSPGPNGTPPNRRSWFTNLSSKFSSSPGTQQQAANGNINNNNNNSNAAAPPQTNTNTPPKENPPTTTPRYSPPRHAVLQHANKPNGDQPYTPAPPSRGQSSFFGVLRRLSSSGGTLSGGQKGNHGLVERKVLNVDPNRERCAIAQLHQAKLRRVAFSVDVEIAPQPRYSDSDGPGAKAPTPDKTQKRKLTEKSEGEALKNPKMVEEQKEQDGVVKATGEPLPKEPEKEGTEAPTESSDATKDAVKSDKPKPDEPAKNGTAVNGNAAQTAADRERETKKKEKKKKSEEERKARKEKKRKMAEANGTIPMEIHLDDSDSSAETSQSQSGNNSNSTSTGPKTTSSPTTNPVRIYRRCCQLRETPILKKITEQLTNSANCSNPGVVDKLDLTGYWLQLADLITLGDYLAVVPVKELLLENCGLSDEGLRVVLAGLLAAKRPDARRKKQSDCAVRQSSLVERLVLKNNKIGLEGWKHICLFIYLSRSLKHLDISMIPFPRPPAPKAQPNGQRAQANNSNNTDSQQPDPATLATLLSKAVGQRLAGSTLELLHIGGMKPTTDELGIIIDGVIECGVKRLGLAHNDIDEKGLEHVARFIEKGYCEGLDLGGNDLREHMDVLAKAITPDSPLWGLSLAECNLRPGSLCKIFPKLVPLTNLRFIDLSHNQDLCKSEPNAVGLLRKYLPKLQNLKRVHLADIDMTSTQAIALAEIIPEVQGLAHISFLENPALVKLADATTEESREEACALYASLLAATRISDSIVCVDIDVPSERSGEVVKAMAKQVVAYCLRNVQRIPIAEIGAAVQALSDGIDTTIGKEPPYPDVLVHLVGHDVLNESDSASDHESAPDDDYVIGGTGLAKALSCCLENRGQESSRQSGEFIREMEEEEGRLDGTRTPNKAKPALSSGKAKDMSKHLLLAARKIRVRLQPAVSRAKRNSNDEENLRKLMFLDTTLANIIKQFEDEFPDTRIGDKDEVKVTESKPSPPVVEVEPEQVAIPSDGEDDFDLLQVRPSLSRTNSALSHSSRALADEEGRVLRTGHRFRSGIVKPEHYDLLNGLDEMFQEPKNVTAMQEVIVDLHDPELTKKMHDKGVVRLFREDREDVRDALRRLDPEFWERFVESQEKARGNVQVTTTGGKLAGLVSIPPGTVVDESAVAD